MYRVCTSKEELDKCPTDECEAYYYNSASRPDMKEEKERISSLEHRTFVILKKYDHTITTTQTTRTISCASWPQTHACAHGQFQGRRSTPWQPR